MADSSSSASKDPDLEKQFSRRFKADRPPGLAILEFLRKFLLAIEIISFPWAKAASKLASAVFFDDSNQEGSRAMDCVQYLVAMTRV